MYDGPIVDAFLHAPWIGGGGAGRDPAADRARRCLHLQRAVGGDGRARAGLRERARDQAVDYLLRRQALADHRLVGEFTGVGLIGGIELVEDKTARSYFAKERGVGAMVEANALRRGLILRVVGDRIAFSPPLIITATELREMAARLRGALGDTLAELGTGLAA